MLAREYSKGDKIFHYFAGIIPIVNMILLFTLGFDSSFKKKKNDLNKAFKCNCGIVSRKYQLTSPFNDKELKCPHCNNNNTRWNSVVDDRIFPFAPKLNTKDAISIMKEANKAKSVKKEIVNIEEYDKEVEAWEKLQLSKMEEYQCKANEIKKEIENRKFT